MSASSIARSTVVSSLKTGIRIDSESATGGTLSVSSERTRTSVGTVAGGPEGYDRAVRELTIDGRRIADDTACFVIAEIGHNHQGSVEKAQELFVLAKQAGVDAVKLQKRDNRRLFTRELYDSPYDNESSFGPTYGEHREALELDRSAYVELQACARELGLVFFATAFDEASADLLEELDVPAYKIASGDLRNTPLMRHVPRSASR